MFHESDSKAVLKNSLCILTAHTTMNDDQFGLEQVKRCLVYRLSSKNAQGVDNNDIKILVHLYKQVTSVRLDSGTTTMIFITDGVRQGCVLSPHHLDLYSYTYVKYHSKGQVAVTK